MLGFMTGCAFLSMWVQNTSAVAMVMPIVEAVLQQILKVKEWEGGGEENPNLQLDGTRIHISFCLYQNVKEPTCVHFLPRSHVVPPTQEEGPAVNHDPL